MAKPHNPLFSFNVRGSLAKALTFRRHGQQTIAESIPTHPDAKTPPQLAWRVMYQKCTDLWHTLSAAEQQTWESLARPKHMTGYAYYMSLCLRPNPGIYLPLAGGVMTGNIDMDGNSILNAAPITKTSVYITADATPQTFATATETLIEFNTEVTDALSEFNPATYTFTAKANKTCLLSVKITWNGLADGKRAYVALKRGAEYLVSFFAIPGATGIVSCAAVGVIPLSLGDTIKAYARQDSGIAVDLLPDTNVQLYIQDVT